MSMDFIDCGCQLLHSGRLLCRPLGQGLRTAGHLVRTVGYLYGAGIQPLQRIVQCVDGMLEGCLDGGKVSHIVHVHL